MKGFLACLLYALLDVASCGPVVSSSSTHSTQSQSTTFSPPHQEQNFILASGDVDNHKEDIRGIHSYPEIFDHLHCILDELQALSSSTLERLVRKCVRPNNHFPPPFDSTCHSLLNYFEAEDLEEDNDLYNNEDNKGRADRDIISRKLCSKISGSSDWRIASKAVDILHRIVVRYSKLRDTEVVAEMNEARIKEVLVVLDKKIEALREEDDPIGLTQWRLIYYRLCFILVEWTHLQIQRHHYLEESLKSGVLPTLNQCVRYMSSAAKSIEACENVLQSQCKTSSFALACSRGFCEFVCGRIVVFVDMLNDLQPWSGGFNHIEQAMLDEIQSTSYEIVETYRKIIHVHSKMVDNQIGEMYKKEFDEGSETLPTTQFDEDNSTADMTALTSVYTKLLYPTLPSWLTKLTSMQTRFKEEDRRAMKIPSNEEEVR